MEDGMDNDYLIGIFTGAILMTVLIGLAWTLTAGRDEDACAKRANVFACERVVTWVPVAPEAAQ